MRSIAVGCSWPPPPAAPERRLVEARALVEAHQLTPDRQLDAPFLRPSPVRPGCVPLLRNTPLGQRYTHHALVELSAIKAGFYVWCSTKLTHSPWFLNCGTSTA
jgi:hypothetical protein